MRHNMSEDLRNDVIKAVSVVCDPHMGVSIVDVGIVQSVEVEDNVASITIKPTNPGCMSVTRMAADAKAQAEKVEGIEKVKITVIGHAMADSLNEMLNK